MRPNRWLCGWVSGALLAGWLAGNCTAASTEPASTQPAVCGLGFACECPADWKLIAAPGDFAMRAVPVGSTGQETDPSMSIEVPHLPPHIPGMIPVGSVADGYVQDMGKRYPGVKVDQRTVARLDGASARRIICTYECRGKAWRDLVLLAVRGDHVYVIAADCLVADFDKTRAGFDALLASIHWTGTK